jgi:heterodisulfide reductase subunit A-like polyferredoxin
MVFLKTQHWLHYLWIYAFLLKIGNDILYMSTNRELVTSMIVYCTQTASESDAFSKMSASTEKQKQNIIKKGTIYDAIIVGGGGAGCPLARTLAEVGLKVLLIERGGSRSEYPSTLDIYGIGMSVIHYY